MESTSHYLYMLLFDFQLISGRLGRWLPLQVRDQRCGQVAQRRYSVAPWQNGYANVQASKQNGRLMDAKTDKLVIWVRDKTLVNRTSPSWLKFDPYPCNQLANQPSD